MFLAISRLGANDVGNLKSSQYANWSRQVAYGIEAGSPFTVVSTTSIEGRLSAGCVYRYIPGNASVTLRGLASPNADLAPFVTYEVASKDRAEWKTVGRFQQSHNAKTIKIDSSNPSNLLTVDMEPFRASIGKRRWGRLLLENGASAIFAIDDLLPTGDSPAAGAGNFKQELDDPDPTRFGSSFELVAVTSFSDRIIGDFVFIGNSQVTSTDIKGVRSEDGDFWPDAIVEAGNSGEDWQTLQNSDNSHGTPTSLTVNNKGTHPVVRVLLTAYKKIFARFRYGKVTFSGGAFAVFQTEELKPKP